MDVKDAVMILEEIRRTSITTLTKHYSKEEAQSLFYLLAEVFLKLKRIDVALNLKKEIDNLDLKRFNHALNRLKQQEPIQYILGETEFYGLLFKLTSNVLIPRPETEELVDWIIKDTGDKSVRVLDIGTGSGCIAITLAHHLPNSYISALDVSSKALEVAKSNANLNKSKVNFIQANILEHYTIQSETYDIIVSNPPYVRDMEKEQMKPNVLSHEPHLALFVPNKDPLLFYMKIIDFSKTALRIGGALYFEINEYLGNEMKVLLQGSGFSNIELKQDLYGKDRMIKAIKL